ncbi:MAG: YggS family pyridoxal phosphate-dependent enzyme [Firmicutes bacterium]|nr:YggS family pyridoxal phosphate-dependent enzyme [Bacillota bacterium]
MPSIEDNIALLRDKIEAAAVRSGRRLEDIRIIAVTKTVPADKIDAAVAAGLEHIGESRVQEAASKKEIVAPGPMWHLIGHLQRNKAKHAIRLFDFIHSVDSWRLARALQRRAEEADLTVNCLVQVNISGEKTKYGVSPDQLVSLLKKISSLSRLNVHGLMTIAPYAEDPEEVRPIFRQLRQLAERVDKLALPRICMQELSMGMSGDFEPAIEEGATMVRIGSAIFKTGLDVN